MLAIPFNWERVIVLGEGEPQNGRADWTQNYLLMMMMI
jgi:hypothetical protein